MPEKKKIELEYMLRSSNKILFHSLSTPDGLSEWFADNVNIRNGQYIFEWDGSEEKADLISQKPHEYVKFQWDRDEEEDSTEFEFRIKTDPLTQDVALLITDYADEEDVEESTFLWDNQIGVLKKKLGA